MVLLIEGGCSMSAQTKGTGHCSGGFRGGLTGAGDEENEALVRRGAVQTDCRLRWRRWCSGPSGGRWRRQRLQDLSGMRLEEVVVGARDVDGVDVEYRKGGVDCWDGDGVGPKVT